MRWLAEYWADGEHTLQEVVDLVELECGRRKGAVLLEYFQFLKKMGLVELKEA